MIRRHLYASLMLTVIVAVVIGLAYPLLIYGIGQAAFPFRANGSFIHRNGKVVGSALIGQNFLGKDGNPDPRYFQPRPSSSGVNGYDPSGFTCPPTSTTCGASGASNLGPGDPKLVGFIPGFNTVDLKGNTSGKNPFASSSDPFCYPVDSKGNPLSPAPGAKYAKNPDGTYMCFSGTIPERASAYRQLNNLADSVKVPVDAVTASGSGLDPDISLGNARLQAARVAQARHVSVSTVRTLLDQHTNSYRWGFLGEKTVNVLDVNLALDSRHT